MESCPGTCSRRSVGDMTARPHGPAPVRLEDDPQGRLFLLPPYRRDKQTKTERLSAFGAMLVSKGYDPTGPRFQKAVDNFEKVLDRIRPLLIDKKPPQ